jgi:hypothetical protein
MTLGRMIHFYLPEKQLWKLKASSLATYFVWFDILTFIVQGVGGSMASPGADAQTVTIGIHVYEAGISIQEFFILIFSILVVSFHRRMLWVEKIDPAGAKKGWRPLTYTLYAVLALISVSKLFISVLILRCESSIVL